MSHDEKTITQAQVLAVAEILRLDSTYLQELHISVDEVEATYIDPTTSKRGPLVQNIHTYTIDKSTKETR